MDFRCGLGKRGGREEGERRERGGREEGERRERGGREEGERRERGKKGERARRERERGRGRKRERGKEEREKGRRGRERVPGTRVVQKLWVFLRPRTSLARSMRAPALSGVNLWR